MNKYSEHSKIKETIILMKDANCRRKHKYKSEAACQKGMIPYKCDGCDGWHVRSSVISTFKRAARARLKLLRN